MLCSFSSAGGKSGLNWLDRLRSTKGFPAADNLDLDDFISKTTSESTQSHIKRVTSDQSPVQDCSTEKKQNEWFNAVSNVLCDLFNMGDSQNHNPRFSGKKNARKQTNPRFFDSESSSRKEGDVVQVGTTASFQSDNNSNVVGVSCDLADDEKEKCSSDKELKGYSKSEVTIIDTSFEVWKFDKVVYRRKNVWKIRDKKGKSWNFCSKKRKANHHLESANGNSKKKANFSNSEFASSVDDQKACEDEKREVCKDTLVDPSQVSKKRTHFSRSPRKLKKNCSSVVLIKAIPTSKKCGKNLLKNRLEESQRQECNA